MVISKAQWTQQEVDKRSHQSLELCCLGTLIFLLRLVRCLLVTTRCLLLSKNSLIQRFLAWSFERNCWNSSLSFCLICCWRCAVRVQHFSLTYLVPSRTLRFLSLPVQLALCQSAALLNLQTLSETSGRSASRMLESISFLWETATQPWAWHSMTNQHLLATSLLGCRPCHLSFFSLCF